MFPLCTPYSSILQKDGELHRSLSSSSSASFINSMMTLRKGKTVTYPRRPLSSSFHSTVPSSSLSIPKRSLPSHSFYSSLYRTRASSSSSSSSFTFFSTTATPSFSDHHHQQEQQQEQTNENHTAYRSVGYWLLGTAGMVFIMVVLGGVTRLTRSGLSIVEWRPEGETYPMTPEEWEKAFDKYKAFPEYQKVNTRMTLDEFKPIYFMEWFHRMWGRAIGIAFTVPFLYFIVRQRIPPGFRNRFLTLLGLGAAQGGVGWWMVKSGLEHERFTKDYQIPRVSPYRLATHLGFAWTVYSLLVWNAWDILKGYYGNLRMNVTQAQIQAARTIRPYAYGASSLIGITIASGAFVAGNDAGHAYNDWPLFAGRIVPEQIWDSSLGLRNFTENTATVQFDHRNLAYASIGAVGLIHMACKRAGWKNVHPSIKQGAMMIGGLVVLQATLGITTLLLYVPVSLGAAHQGGALALWTSALYLAHSTYHTAKQTMVGTNGSTETLINNLGTNKIKAAGIGMLGLCVINNKSLMDKEYDE